MRVAARHGGRFVFFKSSYIGGVSPGYPPNPLNTAKNVDFGYPPKIRVLGVEHARSRQTWGTICFFYNPSYIGGVPLGYPPKPLKTAKNGHFGYPPKNRVFGVQNARMAGLVHLLFRIFRKNLSLIRGRDNPKGGPPLGGTPPMGVPPS
jgi:hypothetical protein